jgi:sulfur carrier protein ThiS
VNGGPTVTVRLNGELGSRLGPRRTLTLAPGATVADLLSRLAAEAGLPPRPGLAVALAGELVGPHRELADGDEPAVLTPVAGG